MNTDTHQLTVCGIQVQIVRKAIKNLHLGVYPPNGRVRVAAPLDTSDSAIRLAVIAKLGWIKRHKAGFDEQDRQEQREYVSGESHYYQGIRYRLNVLHQEAVPKVVIRNKTRIDLYVRPGSTMQDRERAMLDWYRTELKAMIPGLLVRWEPVLGVKVAEWGVKRMKTHWGACNANSRRIWLNLELAKKSVRCLEFILVHELVHLLERHHNDRFVAYMDRFMPQWKTLKKELNRAPLGYESWVY